MKPDQNNYFLLFLRAKHWFGEIEVKGEQLKHYT